MTATTPREAERGDGAGDDLGDASDLRHGFPPEVMPRHVVEGFFESDL